MCFLARWRGFRLSTDYFDSIPVRSTLGAALVASGVGGAYCLVVLSNRVATLPTLPCPCFLDRNSERLSLPDEDDEAFAACHPRVDQVSLSIG